MTAGAGGYSLDAPGNLRFPPQTIYRTARVQGPTPSNQWWTSLAWERYSGVMTAHPLSLRAVAGGLQVSYPRLSSNADSFRAAFRPDLTVGVQGLNAPDARVDGFGDWTVDAEWRHGSRRLRATFGHGLPYAFFRVSGGAATLTLGGQPDVLHRAGGSIALRVNGRPYAAFAPAGSTWRGSGANRTVEGARFLSVAALPDDTAESFALLAEHAFARPTGSRVAWRWDQAGGRVESTFSLATEDMAGEEANPPALQALYPHHWARLRGGTLPGLAFESPRGPMRLVAGSSFSTSTPYTGIVPALPAPTGPDRDLVLRHLRDYVENRSHYPVGVGETRMASSYWEGKNFGRNADLLAIAEQLGEREAAARLLDGLRAQLEKWLEPTAAPALYYDRSWGTLIPYPTGFGADYDLNDHHFHYAYFLQAAASIAERDPDWARPGRWGAMVSMLLRDVAALRGDAMFPFLRALDVYAGHGWASGSATGERGPNQESSSEAINFAAALIRWAEAIGDQKLLEQAVWMYAVQVDTAWAYWFARPENAPNYSRTAVGILFGDGGDYRTWFSQSPGAIIGINILPVTGGSLYLARDKDFVRRNFASLGSGTRPPSYWPDINLLYLALADPHAARDMWNDELPVEFGETRAHTLHWLASLSEHGTPNLTVSADTAQFAVLERDGQRTHVAFNPTGEA
ncbi:MAG TPA: glycosyl hydrolase, partial [Deinococcales bacterium]|nr:glycosyl hydrolase [Deinococcales bacterium]